MLQKEKTENVKIGIDKIVLSIDLRECKVDLNKLQELNAMIVKDDNTSPCRVLYDENEQRVYIKYIKIDRKQSEIKMFDRLAIGKEVDFTYNTLEATLPTCKNKTNINNVSTERELLEVLELIQQELKALGFGNVDLKSALIKEIEINVNVPLEREFKEYEKVFEYCKELLPKGLKATDNKNGAGLNGSYKGNNGEYTGFKVGNGSRTLKFYDKKTNVLKKYGEQEKGELLRIEYRYMNTVTVKNNLGTNRLGDLLEDKGMERVRKAFKDSLEKDLINRVYKDIDKQLKHARKYLKSRSGKRSAIYEYIIEYKPIDVEILMGALKEVGNSNYKRACITILEKVGEYESTSGELLEINRDKFIGNIKRINEVLGALGYKNIELEKTQEVNEILQKLY